MANLSPYQSFLSDLKQYIADVVARLPSRINVHFTQVIRPQSFLCFEIGEHKAVSLQLRVTLLAQSNGSLFGRLSWLDNKGIDHLCCYINDQLKPLVSLSFHQTKPLESNIMVEDICENVFKDIEKRTLHDR